jgi:hypothetical protein
MSQEHELYVRDKNQSMEEIRPDPQHLLGLKLHWGLHRKNETLLFYGMIIPCWCLEIAAAADVSLLSSSCTGRLGFRLHLPWRKDLAGGVTRRLWKREYSSFGLLSGYRE